MTDNSYIPATHLPLLVFAAVYCLTSLIGIVLFWFQIQPATELAEYFSGVTVPSGYTLTQHLTLVGLALGAPLMMALGYHLAVRCAPRHHPNLRDRQHATPYVLASASFLAMTGWASYAMWETGVFGNLIAWSNQGGTIAARYTLFAKLHFFEFGAIYLFVPLAAAALVSRLHPRSWVSHKAVFPFTAAAIAVGNNILLFQKRAAVIAALLILSAVAITQATTWLSRRAVVALSLGSIGLSAIIYFGLVLGPAMTEVTPPKQSLSPEVAAPAVPLSTRRATVQLAAMKISELTPVDGMSKLQNLTAYALLAPISRTSIPALYYVTTYPYKHPFYGLDVGQDILGFGEMPDDAHVVWREMYPSLQGSSTAAYQFVLYSQVGLYWTLALSLAVGAIMGVSWKWVVLEGAPGSARQALLGSVILLGSLYLAMDGIRTSLLSSYGVIWAWLFVLLLLRTGGAVRRWA